MKPLPLITLSPAAGDTLCVGQEIIFTVTTGPNMNWVWLQPGNLMGSTTNPVTQTLTSTTIFQVVGVDTLTNCSNVATVIVPVVTELLPGIIAENQTICVGEIPDLLTAQMANGGTGTYAYQWEISTTSGASGFSDIPGETGLTYQPGVTTQNTWYRIRVSSPPCPDEYTNTIEIHVHEAPIVNSAPAIDICSGTSVAYTPSANIAGTTYTWTSQIISGVVTGVTASGSGTINDILTLPAGSSATGTVRYIITPTGPTPSFCVGNPFDLLVTVYPTPLVTNVILSQDICAGSTTNPVILQSNVAAATYTWSAIATPGISGFIPSGSGNIPAMQILSNLLVAGSVTYTITPHGNGPANCDGPTWVYEININPSPSVTNNPMQQTICSGGTTLAVTLTSNMPIPDFTWTATAVPAGVSGFQVSGTNTIPAQTITNPTNIQGIVTYNIVPGGSFNGCPGIPRNYLVYVNPIPVATATPGSEIICSGQSTNIVLSSNVANTTFSWTASGPATLSGYSNSNGTSIVQNITNSGIVPEDVTYIITPVADGCTGLPITVIVTVAPTPSLTTNPLTQTICSGNTVIINLTGIPANASFSWTASGVGVTGYSNGSGATIAQTLTNNTNIPRNVVYSITTSANGCTTTSVNYSVLVNPTPVVNNNPLASSICSGATFNLAISSNVAGTTYIWTANGTPGISGLSGGSGNTISQQLLNSTNLSGSVTYTITPSANSCVGSPENYIVTVHPIPDVALSLTSQSICSGTSSTAVAFSSTVPGTTFSWAATPSGAGISGYTASGSAGIPSQIISSTLSAQGTVTYAVTPSFNGCTGSIASHVITVNPLPLVTNPTMSQDICTGATTANVNLLSNVSGTSFTWTATPSSAAITGFQNSGGNTIPPQTITNSSLVPGTVTYQIIPTSNFGPDCQGTAANYIITINPLPSVTSNLASAVCSGQPFNYTLTSNLAGSSYTWSRAAVAGISNPPGGGSASVINEVLNNLTGSDIVVTYVLTPFGPTPTFCQGSSVDLLVTVRALPQITAGIDLTIPHGTSTLITGLASGGTGTLSYTWTPAAFIATGANTLTPYTENLTNNRNFTLTVTDAAGCSSNDGMTVFITGTPLAVLPSAVPSSICLNQSSTIQANASGGSGTYTYLWSSNPAGFMSTSSSVTVFPVVNTVYTVIVDDGFNTVSSSVAVTVNPLPVQYQLTGGGNYCTGGSGVNVGLAGSQNGVTYQLYNNGNPVNSPVSGNGGSLSFGNQTLAGIYTVVATRVSTGCTNAMGSSVSVSINSLPIADAGVDQTIPFGTSTTLNGSVSGGFGSMNYSWTPIAFIGVGANTAAPLTTNLYSNTTFTLQITDANGCSGTDQMVVSLSGSAINVVAVATPNQICADTSQAQLQAVVNGGAGTYSYIWTCIPAGSPAWTSMQQNPMVSPDVTTTYTIVANDGFNTATASATVVVNPLPFQFGLTGGGAYCYGYQGVEIGLSGSQTNVDYQLYRAGTADGPPVTGTGNPISFGFHTEAFTYTVVATNNTTGCMNLMTGTATIDILDPPLTFWVTGGGSYPFGGPGRNVGLVHGDPGVSYQLYCNNAPVGSPVMGNNAAIDFGLQTLAGTYTVIATDLSTGCTADMLGSVDIFILPVPALFLVTGGGTMCSGGPGLLIGLTGSETGVDYQLLINGFPTGPLVPGTNLELSWGPLSTAGLYEVLAINTTNGISQMMQDHAEIVVNPSPTIYSLNPTGPQCPGTILRLNGSEAGMVYDLLFEGAVVDTRVGTGIVGFLDFGPQTMNGTYTIRAVNPITGCEIMMNGSMYINVSPQIFGIIPAGILCPGLVISLTGSQTGVNYQLRRNGTFDFGPPVPGTGLPLVLGMVGLPGVYTAIAIDALTNCVSYMNDSATLYPDPSAFTIVPDGAGCEGDIISLNGSQTGVNYVLLLDNAIHIDTLAGTGTSISFGPQFTQGNYTILAINQSSYCLYTMNGTAVLNDSPINYNLLPSGMQCAGSTIGLSGSQAGVSYQLIMNGIFNIGPVVPGTGTAISFGQQNLSGVYTIRAVNDISGCNVMMSDSLTLEPKPIIYTVLPAGSYCAGIPIRINGSEININYILILNGSIHLDTLQGTGNMIDFGPQFITGAYTIIAYNPISFCTESMSGTTTIEAAPAKYNLTPAGITCSGTSIGLDNSDTGVSYQLRRDGFINVGAPLPGTGSLLDFGTQTVAGEYTIEASGTNGCPIMMNGSVVLYASPTIFTQLPAGSYCPGQIITLNGSENGINYILYRDGIFPIDTLAGNGIILSFGNQYTAGNYTIIAVSGISNCQDTMSGSTTIYVGPTIFNTTPAGNLCIGTVIGLNNSELGVTYQLRRDGITNVGAPIAGTGSAISFGIMNIAGSYSILATSTVNGCVSIMNGNSVLQPSPILFTIAPQGIQCAGTSITLNGSQIGTEYVLVLDNFFNLDTISGNGSVLDFGPQFITGIYTIEAIGGTASCQAVMQGSVQMMALPASFNVTPAGLICLSATIGLDGSETDVDYTLFKNGITTGITLPGTGFALTFGVQTSGDYTVKAVNQISNCSIFMPATIHIGSDPVANAGADANICENQSANLNGSATNYGSLLWSSLGDGNFDNSGSFTALYTPGTVDVAAGIVNLILTVNGNGGCALSVDSDTVTITIDKLATANVGGEYNVCSVADYTINGASATNYSTINWVSGGTGNLINGNTLTPTYIPSAADLSAGSVTLTLSATGISPCTNIATDVLTMTFLPMVSANAGPDDLICAGNTYTFSGATATNYQGVSWASSGTGSFTAGNILAATYSPSAADTASGSTMLILTASSIAPCAVTSSDTMVLSYIHAPASNAGSDLSACENTSVSINDATAFNSTSLTWSTSGTGNFPNNAIINPIYLPSTADIASGFVTLTLTVNGDASCAPDVDEKIISFIMNPVVYAGSDAHMCTSPFVLSGATSSDCASVLWTIQSGSGLISNAGTLNPTYTPSALDIANGSVILLLTGTPLNPCTTAVSDQVTLYINQMPLVNAGPDGATCDNSNYTVNDATAAQFSSLIWTSTGTGTLLNETTLNPSYLPSAADITMGSVVLTLTASNAGCGMVSDNKVISFINQTTANAGPDISVCAGTSLTIGGASASAYSSIFWSTSGTGTITNGNTLSPIYTPSAADIANGSAILTLNAVSVAPCINIITDHTTLTILPTPIVAAGNDAVICSTDSYNNNNAAANNYGILTWSTSGTGFFDNPAALVNTYTPSAADIAGGSVILTLTATNNAPCADVWDEKVISFQQGPTVDAGPGATICNMCTFGINGASVQNSVSLHWATSGSGMFSNASVINPTYTPSATDIANGSVILSLTAYSTPPCTQITDTLTLIISNNPGVNFTWGAACENQPVSFTVDTSATNTGAVSQWIWNFGDGNSSNLMNPSHLFASLGEFTVTLATIDTAGNVSMMLHHVTVTELPVAFFSHDTPGCSNDLIHFNDQAWTLYGYIAKWIWEYGDGSANDTVVFPDDPNVLHQYAAPGLYYVTLTVTNSFGCIDQVTLPVDVIEAPIANFTFDNNCLGLETSFVDASYANGPGNTVQYLWFFGDPASGFNNYSELKDATHLFSVPGVYLVKHVVRNFNNCTDTITKTVTILTPASVDFIYGYTCVNGISEFAPDTSVVNVSDITGWEWNFGDGITDFQPYSTHVYLQPGTYQVTLTVTDSAGCKASKTRPVVVNPLPVAMFNVSQLPCEDATVTFDDVSMTYAGFITQVEWNFGDGNTQQINYPSNTDTEHIYTEAGTYIVSLTIHASDSCTSEYTQTISINPAPLANFEYENACQGKPVLFTDLTSTGGTGAISGWSWNFGDEASGNANISTIQNPSHTYANSGIFQVSLTTTAENGCTSIKTKPVTITAAPFVDFSFDTRCVNTDIQFTPSAAVNTADVQVWEWSFGDGFFSAQPNPVHTYSTPGSFIVSLTITNLAGCQNSESKTIIILPAPVANFVTSTPACSGQDVTFTNQSNAPTGNIMSWEYNFGDGSSQTINYPSNPNITHSYSSYGNFTVTLTVVTNDNCSASTTRTITILQSPLANFDFDGTCAGSAVQFTDLSQGNLVLWTWNFGDSGSGSGNTSTQQNPAHTYQQPGIYTVTLLVQNSNGCYDTGIRTVTILPKPVVNFSYNNGCAADTVHFNSSSYVAVATTVSWLWEFGDNTTSAETDPTHIYALPGTYIVSLSIINQNGCTNSKTHQVQITVPPIAIFSSNSPSCSGTAVLFDDMSSTSNGIISTWSWDFGDGSNSVINAPANPNVVHSYAAAGIFEVILTIYTSTGCEASYTSSVSINDNPVSAFSSAENCSGQATFFTDLSQTAGVNSIVSWNWDFGDLVSGINNISSLQNPQHQYSEPGNYIVTLTTQNSAGCSNTVNQTIVIEPKPAVDFIVTPSCLGTAVSFGVNPAVTNVPDIATYLWDFGDGSPTSGAAAPDHLYTLTGSYVVTLTITNLSGCENSVSHTQTVHSIPVAQFTHSGNCASGVVHFTDNSYNPGEEDIISWEWDFGDNTNPGDTSVLQNPTYVYSVTGTYNVTLTVTTETGCASVKIIPVTVLPAPDAQYSFVAEPCHDGSVIFQDESSSQQSLITGWYWEFSPGVYSTLQNPVHVFGNSDTCYFVTLVVTTADGCTDTTTREVCIPSGLDVTFDYTPTCFGENTWFTPTLIQPAGGSIAFYTWNFGDPATGINNTSNLANPQHIFSKPGTFVVSLQATDINNCSTTKYITILVSPLPIANFGYDGGKCDSLVTFTDLTTNTLINTWIWQFGDGKSDTVNSPANPDVQHYYPYPGQFEVTLITQSMAGCSDTIIKTIRRTPCITSAFAVADTVVCQKRSMRFTESSVCQAPIASWQWFFGDNTSATFTTYQPFVEHTYAVAGVYTVKMVVATQMVGGMVTDTSSRQVAVKPAARAAFKWQDVCIGNTAVFENQSHSNSTVIENYIWNFGDPSSTTDTSFAKDTDYNYTVFGQYDVKLVVINTLGCSDTIVNKVSIFENPVADFDWNSSCEAKPVLFTDHSDSASADLVKWNWLFSDTGEVLGASTDANCSYIFGQAGIYDADLTITDRNGCTNSITKQVAINSSPVAAFSIVENYENKQGQIMLSNGTINGTHYEWDFGNGATSTAASPVVTFDKEGSYDIFLTTWNGQNCTDTLTQSYNLMFKGLYVPNAFNPGHFNPEVAVFKPKGTNLKSYRIEIYDRWDNLLWSSEKLDIKGSPAEAWDGTLHGNVLKQDVYLWKISAQFRDGEHWDGHNTGNNDNMPQTKAGTVTLIR